ncbi:MAG: UDP-N-acetylglucosamine 2-epimerase [Rhodospirillales bacterium]
MKRIALVTTSRADYGIQRPLLRLLAGDEAVDLSLIVGGMHLRAGFGMTVSEIEEDGFSIAARVDHLSAGDGPADIAHAMAAGVAGYGEAFDRLRPEAVILLGDRYEMMAAALAAKAFPLAICHLHGGELSLGVLDDSFRHAITKFAHLHFVACERYAQRVRQLGEEDWRITVAGALGLDNLEALPLARPEDLAAQLDLAVDTPPVLVTYHPTTPDDDGAALLAALGGIKAPMVFTAANADAGGRALNARIEAFVAKRPQARLVAHLGTARYFGLMDWAVAMVGNSSSGILEAASFKLPVVNIGDRQEGRERPANVIDCDTASGEILKALDRARSQAFRAEIAAMVNPFRSARSASEVVFETIKETSLDRRLLKKGFVDQ